MTLAYKSEQTVFRRRLNSIPTFAFNLDQASNKKKKKLVKVPIRFHIFFVPRLLSDPFFY